MYHLFWVGLKTWLHQSLHIVQIFKRGEKKRGCNQNQSRGNWHQLCLWRDCFAHFLGLLPEPGHHAAPGFTRRPRQGAGSWNWQDGGLTGLAERGDLDRATQKPKWAAKGPLLNKLRSTFNWSFSFKENIVAGKSDIWGFLFNNFIKMSRD